MIRWPACEKVLPECFVRGEIPHFHHLAARVDRVDRDKADGLGQQGHEERQARIGQGSNRRKFEPFPVDEMRGVSASRVGRHAPGRGAVPDQCRRCRCSSRNRGKAASRPCHPHRAYRRRRSSPGTWRSQHGCRRPAEPNGGRPAGHLQRERTALVEKQPHLRCAGMVHSYSSDLSTRGNPTVGAPVATRAP